jgi:aldose 1-epimerase
MLYHIETDERAVNHVTHRIYTLTHGRGGTLAETWPSIGFNCLRWRVQTSAAEAHDLLYHAPDWSTNPVPTRSGIPILFPFPNRIRAGVFHDQGKEYRLPLNDPGQKNAIHGFAPRHGWRVFGYRVEMNDAWIHADFQASKDAPETAALWPGDYILSVTYRLSESTLRLESRVHNVGNHALPFGLGFHPYLRFPCSDPDISRYRLHAPARSLWQLEDSLPTGKKVALSDDLNWNRPKPVGTTQLDTLYGDLGVITERQDGLFLRAQIGHEEYPGALQLWASIDFRESVLFTPVHRQAICIEPYTCATDAVNLQAKGIDAGWKTLAPGQTWSGVIEFRWDPTATL